MTQNCLKFFPVHKSKNSQSERQELSMGMTHCIFVLWFQYHGIKMIVIEIFSLNGPL